MTTLQINAILVVLILAGLAATMCYLLIHFSTSSSNGELPIVRFMFIGSLLKDIILALIGIGWWFARRAEPPKEE